jgi:hypothetical protein
MSISIASGVSAPLLLTGLFPVARAQPITLLAAFKVSAWPGSGFYTVSNVELLNAANDSGHRITITGGGSSQNLDVRSFVPAGTVGSSSNLSPNLSNQWRVAAGIYVALNDVRGYAFNPDGSVLALPASNGSRSIPSVSNIRFMDQTYNFGERKLSHVAVYESLLTEAQLVEYNSTGNVAGVAPYAKWDMNADWAGTGGQILDSSGNGNHLTPPAGWVYSADSPAFVASGPDYTQRKGSTFDANHTLGTITTATLNGAAITINSTGAGTVNLTDTSGITTSGEYNLVLGDGAATQTQTVQVNVFGVVPSNNPAQKDGSALASLTGIQIRITAGANLNGTQVYYSGTEATDASGNFNTLDVSTSAAVAADPVRMQVLTAAGDSITSAETVGLI